MMILHPELQKWIMSVSRVLLLELGLRLVDDVLAMV